MLNFVRKAFRGGLEVILWLLLIGCVICGGIVGYAINYGGGAFLGVIIGIIVGLLIDIIGGGFIATILNIDENTEKQNRLLMQQISLFCKNGKIILKRISSDKIADKSIDISIDDKQRIHLSNGEEKTINLEGGNHKIAVEYNILSTYDSDSFSQEAEFMINNNVKNINISIDPELKIEII